MTHVSSQQTVCLETEISGCTLGGKFDSTSGTKHNTYTIAGQKSGEIEHCDGANVIEKAYDGGLHVLNKQKHGRSCEP